MQTLVSKTGNWVFSILAVLGLLLFTYSGGISKVLLAAGVHVLATSAVVDLLDFWKYGKRPHWRTMSIKVAGTVALLVALVLDIIRPEPPGDPGRYCRTYLQGTRLMTGCLI